jgi:hypothetical protein
LCKVELGIGIASGGGTLPLGDRGIVIAVCPGIHAGFDIGVGRTTNAGHSAYHYHGAQDASNCFAHQVDPFAPPLPA